MEVVKRTGGAVTPATAVELDLHAIWSAELPYQQRSRSTRLMMRLLLGGTLHLFRGAYGVSYLLDTPEPFILAVNHTQYAEAVIVPTVLMFLRGGRPIRFLADWNLLLIPGLRGLMRRAETIPVTTKAARPRWLTRFRRRLVTGPSGIDGARRSLA